MQNDWQIKHTWRYHWVCQRSMLTPSLQKLLHDPNSAFHNDVIKVLKQENVCTIVVIRCADQLLVVKRYNLKGLGHRIRRALSRSRAWYSWHNAHRLIQWGINTPTPVAYIEQRYGPLRRTAFYINQYIEGDWLCNVLPTKPLAIQQSIVTDVTRMLATIHQHGFVHGDMKSTNMLVDEKNRTFLIDLDAMHHPKWNKQRKRLKDRNRLLRNWQYNSTLLTQFTQALDKYD